MKITHQFSYLNLWIKKITKEVFNSRFLIEISYPLFFLALIFIYFYLNNLTYEKSKQLVLERNTIVQAVNELKKERLLNKSSDIKTLIYQSKNINKNYKQNGVLITPWGNEFKIEAIDEHTYSLQMSLDLFNCPYIAKELTMSIEPIYINNQKIGINSDILNLCAQDNLEMKMIEKF